VTEVILVGLGGGDEGARLAGRPAANVVVEAAEGHPVAARGLRLAGPALHHPGDLLQLPLGVDRRIARAVAAAGGRRQGDQGQGQARREPRGG
jgi:hypothetical protein